MDIRAIFLTILSTKEMIIINARGKTLSNSKIVLK